MKLLILLSLLSQNIFAKTYKELVREKITNNQLDYIKSESLRGDDVGILLRGFRVERNFEKLAIENLKEAKLKIQPWSDDYWPIYKGGVAARYADQEFNFLSDWIEAWNFVTRSPANELFQTGDEDLINNLSPAEKFDLLISDKAYLAKSSWAQGRGYYERSSDGSIETWMGICHGWAPASYMIGRPEKAIEVMAYDNKTKIKFYPADIKALASQLWATGKYQNNFIGGRCRSENPNEDSSGRVTDQSCLDNNPATFHLALLNSVGVHGRSFVMDITYDYEVWNQPVYGYRYHFLDFKTKERKLNWRDAIVNLSEIEDPYKKHRAQNAKYAIAIAMEVEYAVETKPRQYEDESSEQDATGKMYVKYDLELDKNYKVIGGEWYQRSHPDFLWTPQINANAMSAEDYYLMSTPLWDGEHSLSQSVKKLASEAASKRVPLAYIVKSLVKKSKRQER